MKKLISIILPAYNEATGLHTFCEQVQAYIQKNTKYLREVIIINDGSKDETRQIITTLAEQYTNIKGIDLSRNFGKEIALSDG